MTRDIMGDLLIHQLRDLYSAERQILLVWPQFIERSTCRTLVQALQLQREEAVRHLARLEEAFGILGLSPIGVRCRGMESLLVDALANAAEQSDPSLRDAGIIADCQRVKGYELAVYGTARLFAESLGHPQIVTMLERTLGEEEVAEATLSRIAELEVRPAVLRAARLQPVPPEVVGIIQGSPSGQRVLRITV